jgi:hypothetical protein
MPHGMPSKNTRTGCPQYKVEKPKCHLNRMGVQEWAQGPWTSTRVRKAQHKWGGGPFWTNNPKGTFRNGNKLH